MEKLHSNYHTHTFRCGHALPNPDEDYVLKAIELGYKNLGFSDHAPFKYIQHPSMRMDFDNGFFDYLKSINTLKGKYKDKINIYIGLEIEYMKDQEDYYKELLTQYKLDYLILGQHCIYKYGEPIYYYNGYDNIQDFKRYTNDLIAGIKSGFFSYVCHPDIFLNHVHEITPEINELIDQICLTAKEYDIPLELNINGETNNKFWAIKHGCYHYPCEHFFKKAIKHGNKIIFGVDAHAPFDFDKIDYDYFSKFSAEIGLNEHNLLKELGFKKVK